MASRELKITLDLDRSKALASARAFRADAAKVNDELLADARARESAEVDLARQAARDKLAVEAVARDAHGRFVASTKAAADASSKANAAANRDQIAGLRQVAAAASAAAKERQAADEKASDTLSGLAKTAGSFAAQMIGLDSVKAVVGAIVDNFEQARNSAYAASKMVNDYREALLELAALKGRLGGTTEAVKEDIGFRSKTLQTAAAARDFQSAALGVGESAIGNQISKEEWGKALVMAGKFQAVEGGGATPHGELIGLIPSLNNRKITGEEAFQKEQQLYKIFQPGGFSFSSGIDQYKKLAPLIQSGVFKDTDAAALLSAFSTTNREGAGENVQQFSRATLGGIGRKGAPRIEGAEKIGEYYKSLGITDDMVKHTAANRLSFEIGNRVSADMASAEEAAKGRGEEFNAYTYLKKKGFGNQEDVNVLMQYAGLKRSGALDNKFMALAADSALPSIGDAMAPIDAAQASDPAMLGRKAALAEQSSNIAVGAGKEEYLASIKRTAFARRRARGEETVGSYDEIQAMGTLSPANVLFGHRRQNDLEAQRMLWAEAERVGVKVPRRAIRMPWTSQEAADKAEGYQGDQALFDLAGQIKAKKGDILPGADEPAAAAARSLDASGRFERGGGAGGPAGNAPMTAQQGDRLIKAVEKQAEKPQQAPPPRQIMPAPSVRRR